MVTPTVQNQVVVTPRGSRRHFPTAERYLKNIGECLWRDNSSGIIYAIIKRTTAGKKIQYKRSLQTTDRNEARKRLSEFRCALAGNSAVITPTPLAPVISPPPQFTASPLAQLSITAVGERWLATRTNLSESTRRRRKHSIAIIANGVGNLPIGELSKFVCEQWTEQHSMRMASSTFNKDLEILKNICDYAKLHGAISESPAIHLRRKAVRYSTRIVPSHSEFVAIISAMRSKKSNGKPPANNSADLAEGIAYLGLRQGEANALKWRDIDWQRKLVKVSGTKTTNAMRVVPLFAPAEVLFRRMQKTQRPQPNDRVFLVKSCKVPLATACKLLALPKLNDHYSLRHLGATMWCEAGVGFKTIGAWLGHSDRDGGSLASKTYTHLRTAFVTDEIAKVNTACRTSIRRCGGCHDFPARKSHH